MLELVVVHNGSRALRGRAPRTSPHRRRPRRRRQRSRPTTPCRPGRFRLATPRFAAQFGWLLPLAADRPVLRAPARRRPSDAGAVGRLAAHLRHRLQRRRRHLPHLLSVGPGAAGRRPCRHRLLSTVASRTDGSRRSASASALRGRSTSPATSLGWTSTWLGFPVVALAAGLAAAWRGKRPPAVDRRPRPARPAGRVGAERDLLAGQSRAAVGQPAALARPRTTAAARCCRALRSRSATIPSCSSSCIANRGDARFLRGRAEHLLAAPVIVHTGQPVMAFGGFFGNEPILTRRGLRRQGEARRGALRGAGGTRATDRLHALGARHRQAGRRAEWRSVSAEGRGRSSSTTLRP